MEQRNGEVNMELALQILREPRDGLILVADDEPLHRKVLSDILRLEGCFVVTAENGFRAIELARSVKPDLILMDIQMPVIDGISAIKVLKADRDTVSIPAIAVTALATLGDRERILEAGFDGYLSKPICITDLCFEVHRHLGRKPERTETALEGRFA